jgi:hypothetical protein
LGNVLHVPPWSFLTNHARAILFLADRPDARLRDLATALDVTERTAFAVVADLIRDGYVVKEKDGRRNRYHIVADRPLRDPLSMERTIGELVELLVEAQAWPERRRRAEVAYTGPFRRRTDSAPAA